MTSNTDKDSKPVVTSFRNNIEVGGLHAPEKDRYHLYISYGCPWSQRASILRKLKGLDEFIGMTVVSPRMSPESWAFKKADDYPGTEDDPLYGASRIRELYLKSDPDYGGRFTVPMLWDKKLEKVVNNESAELIRIFNTGFNDILPSEKAAIDVYPEALRKDIDSVHEWVSDTINSGVYKAGLAKTQKEYEVAVNALFASLDRLEGMLKGNTYLIGNTLTEVDVRLFTPLIRFDPIYYGIYKCNLGSIRHDYPELNRWMKNLYWNNPAFKETTNFDHSKVTYYLADTTFNLQLNPNASE
ncbi:S-glutathionyl-(chloro)hydroquinone reductase [Tulasnella sp. 419]|nr:S-glutathionyl-(chloro)hydroquinone reductase [Tulasnella sp. 419]